MDKSRYRMPILAIIYLCAVGASIQFGGMGLVGMLVIQLPLAISGLFCVVMYCRVYGFTKPDQKVPFCQVSKDCESQLQEFVNGENGISVQQAKVFAMGIVAPTEIRQRLVETYELEHRTIRQQVSIEVNVPARLGCKPSDPIYFPVLVPRKGKFQDNFSLFGADGAVLPMLSYQEYLKLAATTLHLLLATAYDNQDPSSSSAKAIEHAAISGIVYKRGLDGLLPQEEDWKQILSLAPEGEKARMSRDFAAAFAHLLTEHYAIVAIIRPDGQGRSLLKYEQTLVPDLELSSLRTRLGIFLGSRPIDLTLSLDNASTCQSYHMRVSGGDGVYLNDQQLTETKMTLGAGKSQISDSPDLGFRKRLGQPYAHFYARFFPESAPGERRPSIRFRYAEVPAGPSLRAAVSAVAALALIVITGVINSRNPNPGTDIPVFLLAFPAVAATWIGLDVPTGRLLEGTLTARLSLIATVALSVLASGLYMAHRAFSTSPNSSYVVPWPSLPDNLSILWVTDISWSILVLAALVNALHMTGVYLFRTYRFASLSSRSRGSANGFVQNG